MRYSTPADPPRKLDVMRKLITNDYYIPDTRDALILRLHATNSVIASDIQMLETALRNYENNVVVRDNILGLLLLLDSTEDATLKRVIASMASGS